MVSHQAGGKLPGEPIEQLENFHVKTGKTNVKRCLYPY